MAQGTFIGKHFPVLTKAKQPEKLTFIAIDNKVQLFDMDMLFDKYFDLLPPEPSYETMNFWVDQAKNTSVNDGYFTLLTSGNLSFSVRSSYYYSYIEPQGSLNVTLKQSTPFYGDTAASLMSSNSPFKAVLSSANPKSKYVFFYVDSRSVDVYLKAREIAKEQGFDTGWSPSKFQFPVTYPVYPPVESDTLDKGIDLSSYIQK